VRIGRQCGDNWETWGNPHYNNATTDNADAKLDAALSVDEEPTDDGLEKHDNGDSVSPDQPPPYEVDDYQRNDLDVLLPYQFSRFDCKVSKTGKTVSFRRVVDATS
jgi:hypothetical protein